MKPNSKISAAVAAILGAPSTAIVYVAAPADTATAATGTELMEVMVDGGAPHREPAGRADHGTGHQR